MVGAGGGRDFWASLVYNKRTSDPTGYAVAIFSCHCDKLPDRSSLQEEKVSLAHALRGYNLHVRPMPVVKESIVVIAAWGRGYFHALVAMRTRKRNTGA